MKLPDYTLINDAVELAIDEHCIKRDQKYNDKPYVYHLSKVVKVLSRFGYGHDVNLVCAAWLHDILEDCLGIESVMVLYNKFGYKVSYPVYCVTNGSGKNRTEKWENTYWKIKGNPKATVLKLADRISHMEEGGDLVKMYKREYDDFRGKLYEAGMCDQLWDHLDTLMEYRG